MKTESIKALFEKGAVIKVTAKIWSGRKKLSPEELGLTSENQALYSLGGKLIIPKEKIDNLLAIRSKANNFILHSSIIFDFGYFTPEGNIQKLKEKLEQLKSQFYDGVEDIISNLEEYKNSIIQQWYDEADKLSDNDPQKKMEILKKIKSSFDEINENYIRRKCIFEYKEYREINEIANQFLFESTINIIEKLKEYCNHLKERLNNGELQERNLKSLRGFISEMKPFLEIFNNDEINKLVKKLETIVAEGNADIINKNKEIKDGTIGLLDKIIELDDEEAEKIAKKSIEGITSFKREVI